MHKVEKIFSYGTLRELSIQLQLYDRILIGKPDELNHYRLSTITQKENDSFNTYPIAIYSGQETDIITGIVYEISHEELECTDIYEGTEYQRAHVKLNSGDMAWVYVAVK